MSPSDSELVRAAHAGDVTSLGLLLERHRASMQAVALCLLGYSPEAQDAVQEAMLIALQRFGELRDPNAVGGWLRAITRNACRMQLRARLPARSAAVVDQVTRLAEPWPDTYVERHVLREWVWQALEELSEPLQLVVLLRYFTEITAYQQIAAICGVPVGTVRRRLHDGRVKLATALLATSAGGHDDAATLTARRQREVLDLFAAAERGHFGSALASISAPEFALTRPDGLRQQGIRPLVHIVESDLKAGVCQRPMQITSSHRFTVIESDLLSPPWDPYHCPPGVTWLLVMRDNRIEQVRLFHPTSRQGRRPVVAPHDRLRQ